MIKVGSLAHLSRQWMSFSRHLIDVLANSVVIKRYKIELDFT